MIGVDRIDSSRKTKDINSKIVNGVAGLSMMCVVFGIYNVV
jgi:hypothetical protein